MKLIDRPIAHKKISKSFKIKISRVPS